MDKWLSRLDECGNRISKKDFCTKNDTAWVWEAVVVKQTIKFDDWYCMKPPFKWSIAFGYDGIFFYEEGPKGVINRCKKNETFRPLEHGNFIHYDTMHENFWSLSETTSGPLGVIRPILNSSKDYFYILDTNKRGIICFYNKLWVSTQAYYIQTECDQTADRAYTVIYDVLFQPVQMQRFDYIEHLIGRTTCGTKCYDQDVTNLPCIKDCLYDDLDKYDPTKIIDYPRGKKTAKEIKDRADKNEGGCITVCSVCEDCTPYLNTIIKLEEKIETLNYTIRQKDTQIAIITKNNEFLRNEVIELKAAINESIKIIEGLQTENESLKFQLNKCNDTLITTLEAYNKCKNALLSCNSKVNELTKNIIDLKSTIEANERQIKDLYERINKKDREILELQGKIIKKDTEINSLNEIIKNYKDMDLRDILSAFLRYSITNLADSVDQSDQLNPADKSWTGLWRAASEGVRFSSAREINDLNGVLRRFDLVAPVAKKNLLLVSNLIYLMDIAYSFNIKRTKREPSFKLDNILDRHIVYHEGYINEYIHAVWFNERISLNDILNYKPLLQKAEQNTSGTESGQKKTQNTPDPEQNSQKCTDEAPADTQNSESKSKETTQVLVSIIF